MFSTYRRIKRLGRILVKGSSIFGAPVLIAGVCGVIGLAALIYLKKRADVKVYEKERCCSETTKSSRRGCKRERKTGNKSGKTMPVINYEDVTDKRVKKNGPDIWIASATSKTFHKPDCGSVNRISAANRIELKGTKTSLIGKGYKPCASCIGK